MLQNTYLVECFAGVCLHNVLQHTPVTPGRVLGDKPAKEQAEKDFQSSNFSNSKKNRGEKEKYCQLHTATEHFHNFVDNRMDTTPHHTMSLQHQLISSAMMYAFEYGIDSLLLPNTHMHP
jgi:hypothetical protein